MSNAVNKECPPVGDLEFVVGDYINVEQDLRKKKPFVIELFGTWCGPCVASIPHLSQVQSNNPEITIISVSTSDKKEQLTRFASTKRNEITYRLASDYGGDALYEIENRYRARGIPHAYVIDHNGIFQFSGHPMEPGFVQTIERVVEEYKKSKVVKFDVRGHNRESLSALSIKELKAAMQSLRIPYSHLLEKSEFVDELLKFQQ